jgi:hypothetical protein
LHLLQTGRWHKHARYDAQPVVLAEDSERAMSPPVLIEVGDARKKATTQAKT